MSKKFKFWLNIATFIALVVLGYAARHQIVEALLQLQDLNAYALLMIIPIQMFSYLSAGKVYQTYFATVGEHVNLKKLFKISFELNFINQVFPSGGVSGFSYLHVRLRKLGISTAKSTLAQGVRYALTFVSFIVFLVFGMLSLAAFGRASGMAILISTTLACLIVFGAIIAIYIISNEQRIKSFLGFLPKVFNRVVRKVRRHKDRADTINMERLEHVFGELHKDYLLIASNWRSLMRPFFWSMALLFFEIATIYIVYVAFGELINPGALILAYAVANIAGLISIMPGGVGVYETLMTSVLASVGVDSGLAFSATLVYRIINMLLFLPPGYFLYQRALKEHEL